MITVKSMKETFKLSFGEEVANAVSHGVMAALILLAMPFISVYSYSRGGVIRLCGIAVFQICLFLMFLISCIYHSMAYGSTQKYIFRKLDHICIYLAIAGSYTPVALCLIGGWQGFLVIAVEWTAVIIGVLIKSISSKTRPVLSMLLYLCMGWAAIAFLPTLLKACTPLFLGLMLLGGIIYTVGTWFYSHPEHPYFHFIWHLCIDAASLIHFIAIVFVM